MELIISFESFQAGINSLREKGTVLHKKITKSEIDLNTFLEEKRRWESDANKFLSESFTGDQKDFFANAFLQSKSFNFNLSLPVHQQIRNAYNELTQKINNLDYYLRLVRISDSIVDPERTKKEDRVNWTVKQKKILLLQKLNMLNDGKYYDTAYIFEANGISFPNFDGPRQIAKALEGEGYVNLIGTSRGVSASITFEGVEFLENEINDSKSESHSEGDGRTSPDSIDKRLDEVLEWLKRNDMGNEILFDELQEIKEAGQKLSLKNWKELVKGKLFDIATDAAMGIGVSGAKKIFTILTGDDITKLLDK